MILQVRARRPDFISGISASLEADLKKTFPPSRLVFNKPGIDFCVISLQARTIQRNPNALPSHPENPNHTDSGRTVRFGCWVTQLSLVNISTGCHATPYGEKKNPGKNKLSILCFPLMNTHVWWSLILFQKSPSVNLLPHRAEGTCLWFGWLWLDWHRGEPHLRAFQQHTNNRLKWGQQVSSHVAWTWRLPQFWEEALFYVCFFSVKANITWKNIN